MTLVRLRNYGIQSSLPPFLTHRLGTELPGMNKCLKEIKHLSLSLSLSLSHKLYKISVYIKPLSWGRKPGIEHIHIAFKYPILHLSLL